MGSSSQCQPENGFSEAALTTVKRRVANGVSPRADKSGDSNSDQDEAVSGDGEEVNGEEAKTKVLKIPGCPTREELDRHYTTHMPFRSWCPICVQGKAKENPHYRRTGKSEDDKPTVGMD